MTGSSAPTSAADVSSAVNGARTVCCHGAPCSSWSLISKDFLSELSRYVSSKMLPFLPAAFFRPALRLDRVVRLKGHCQPHVQVCAAIRTHDDC